MIVLAAAVVVVLLGTGGGGGGGMVVEGATWCIARSGVTATALQAGLDYACGSGVADCVPVQANGLCYLPNTLPNHASYAFNSYYQRSNAAPGACDFAGTATVTVTDPSYGSCTYPSSASTAGGTTMPTTPSTSPTTNIPFTVPPPPFNGSTGGGGFGGLSPPLYGLNGPNVDTSGASEHLTFLLCNLVCFLLLLFT